MTTVRALFLATFCVLAAATGAFAADEVAYTAGASTLSVPGVVLGGGQYADYEFVLVTSTPSPVFELTRTASVPQAGAASYDATTTRLTIPSVRYTQAGVMRRFAWELTLTQRSPQRFTLTKSTPNTWTAVDSAEAAKVAAWVRSVVPPANSAAHFSAIGVQSLNGIGNRAESVLSAQGPAAMYADEAAVTDASNGIAARLSAAGPMMQAGGMTAFRDVQTLPWGLVEPVQGTYNFTLLDQLVKNYQAYSVDYVGVAMPFASWDLASRGPAAAACQHFFTEDFKYLAAAGRMDRYVNLDRFIAMLQTSVERYDGDGVNDAAGLLRPVKYWQIQNEPEGAACGQFRNDVSAFVELMRRSYGAVKAACPECQVLNGGAGLLDRTKAGGNFWYDYAAQGGRDFIDIVALHYNDGKAAGVTDVAAYETMLAGVKAALGAEKPIWMTEFGVIVNVGGGQFVSFTEAQAAAWYTKFYAAGLNGGVTRFFSDATSFFTSQNGTVTTLLPYYTNRLLESKLNGFTASAKLANGQYRFTVGSASVYVLWSGVPSELFGTVLAYDLYGNESRVDAATLKPTDSAPVVVVAAR